MKAQTTFAYGPKFYRGQAFGSLRSGREIIPHILELTGARSVVDVGCGVGTWLSVYAALGVEDYLGLDGTWVHPRHMLIAPERFRSVDLCYPPRLARRFDLAQSLEVAEHVESAYASGLVAFLTALSDVVVFSGAIPGQGGTNHVNEQWPSYWQALFAKHDYELYDAFRPHYWHRGDIEYWYAQNMFIYVKTGTNQELVNKLADCKGWLYPERIVHPRRIEPAHGARAVRRAFMTLARELRRAAG